MPRRLSHQEALHIIDTIRAELEQLGQGAAVAVSDDHGELIAFVRTDGCRLPSIVIAINKAFTAAREQRETRQVAESVRNENVAMTSFGSLRYTPWAGGVPVVADGEVVGAVGVSGLNEAEDQRLARLGADALS